MCPGQEGVLRGGTPCATLCLASPCSDNHHTTDLRQRRHHRSTSAAAKADGEAITGFGLREEQTPGTTRSREASQLQAMADAVA